MTAAHFHHNASSCSCCTLLGPLPDPRPDPLPPSRPGGSSAAKPQPQPSSLCCLGTWRSPRCREVTEGSGGAGCTSPVQIEPEQPH